MKKVLILISLFIVFIPFSVSAANLKNYNNADNYSKQYINKFNHYQRYILSNSGSMIGKDDFLSTLINGKTYLVNGKEYWTSTSGNNSFNHYFINFGLNEKPNNSYSGVRVTEVLQSGTRVKGNGTYNTPWEFIETYSINITPSVNDSNINISVNPNRVSNGGGATVRIKETPEYTYSNADDCKLTNKTKTADDYTYEYKLLNVKKDVNCVARFEDRRITVKYNCGIGIGNIANQTFIFGSNYELKKDGCARGNNKLSHWVSSDGTKYKLGQTGKMNLKEGESGLKNNTLELTAVYEDNSAPNVKITAYKQDTTTALGTNNIVSYTPSTSTFTNANPFVLNNDKWFNEKITLKIEVSDESNIKSIIKRWDVGNSITKPTVSATNHVQASDLTTNTYSFNFNVSTSGYRALQIEVIDANNNKSTIDINAKMDLVKPTCTIGFDNNKVTLESKTDTLSDINTYGLANNSTVSYNKKTSVNFNIGTYYGFVKDNAGNANTCNRSFTFTPHYRIASTLYETLNKALAAANNSGSTIVLLGNYTDSSNASTAKTVTLDLDSKTLTRTKSIYSTGGTFTIKNGTIVSETDSVDILEGTGGNVTIDKVKMNCINRCVHMESSKKGIGNLSVLNESKLVSKNKQPIRVVVGGTTTVTDSFIYNPNRSETAVSVDDECGNILINGKSVIGMGYTNKKAGSNGIGAGVVTKTKGSTVTITDNAKIMIGNYGGDGIWTDAKTTVNVEGNASIYTLGTGDGLTRACVSISENGKGSTINLNTGGYLYANGYNTALIENTTGTINLTKGHLVSKIDKKMLEINGKRYYTATEGPSTRIFKQITDKNGSYENVKEKNCYYYEKGV